MRITKRLAPSFHGEKVEELLLFGERLKIAQQAGHFVGREVGHQSRRHQGIWQSRPFFDLAFFEGVLRARDVAEAHRIAGFIGDESYLAAAIFEGEDIGRKSLGDGFSA